MPLASKNTYVDLTHLSDGESEEDNNCCEGAPKLVNADPDDEDDGSNPVPGDLVISSLRDVEHHKVWKLLFNFWCCSRI